MTFCSSWWHVTVLAIGFNHYAYSLEYKEIKNVLKVGIKGAPIQFSLKSQQQESSRDKLLIVSHLPLLCLQGRTLIKRAFLLTNTELCLASEPSLEIGSYLVFNSSAKGVTRAKTFISFLGSLRGHAAVCVCVGIQGKQQLQLILPPIPVIYSM